MDPDLIPALEEALKVSPDNAPLRRQLGNLLMGCGRLEDAEELLRAGDNGVGLQAALARCFAMQGKASQAMAVAESLIARDDATPDVLLSVCRTLKSLDELDAARSAYRRAVDLDAEVADPVLAEAIGADAAVWTEPDADADEVDGDDTDEDADTDEQGRIVLRITHGGNPFEGMEVEKPDVNFSDVGGMDALKEQIRLKIIAPLENAELYAAYGKAIGGGILMYGPPGCGKTHLARATAGQIDSAFISVGIHDVLDMYLGNSESKLHALFEYARSNTPCVLFFDEVDALGAKRSDMRGSAGRQVINQFLAELDGVKASNDGLLILAATNAPWSLDTAFRRPGRFDRVLFVPPPDAVSAAAILDVLLKGKPQKAVDLDAVARLCSRRGKGFSGADLKAVVDVAVEAKLAAAMKTGVPEPLTTKDLVRAAKSVKPSTKEWFGTAKNHALYANEGGQYDEVLAYLKM